MTYDPRRKLGEYRESLIYLGFLGGEFARHAAAQLISGQSCPCHWETAFWLIVSAMVRKDADAVRVFLNDWSCSGGGPLANVSKFTPGEHYHCLGAKFDSLEKAVIHIKSRGFRYGGLTEKHVYTGEGD